MQSPSRRSNRRPSMNLIDQVSDQLPLDGTRHLYLVTAIVPQCPECLPMRVALKVAEVRAHRTRDGIPRSSET
jgi:hypothetical protein